MRFAQYYRIGGRVVLLDTPEKLIDRAPYTAFACEAAAPDHTVRFDYAPGPFEPRGETLFENDVVLVTREADGAAAWYHGVNDAGEHEFFAVRRRTRAGEYRVLFLSHYAGRLWPRVAFNLMGLEEFAAEAGLCVAHASFVEKDGAGILFTAPSGGGKSTQAALWARYAGAALCNEDKAILSDGGAYVCGVPFRGSGTVCRNVRLPLRCVVRVEKAPENRVERLRGLDAFRVLFEACYKVLWDKPLFEKNVTLCGQMAAAVPVLRLRCTPDERAVEALRQALAQK